MQSTYWSSWRSITWYVSLQEPETALQQAGRKTGLNRFPRQWGKICTNCTSLILNCLDIPNLTVFSTGRPQCQRPGCCTVCSAHTSPSCAQPAYAFKDTSLLLLFDLFCAYLKWLKCLPVLFYYFNHYISEAHPLISYSLPEPPPLPVKALWTVFSSVTGKRPV